MNPIDQRREFLFRSIDEATRQHQLWVDSDAPYLTAELETAFDNAAADLTTGDIPATCREMCQLATTFAAQWQSWKESATADSRLKFGDVSSPLSPGNAFWKAWEELVNSRIEATPAPPVRLESVKLLREQKVSDNQICEIYGWKNADGRYETWKVQEELDHPGTHVNADYISPAQREFNETKTKQKKRVRDTTTKTAAKVQAINAPPPESLTDLIRQGVSLRQAAEILHRPIADLVAECEAAELTYKFDYESPANARAPQEPEIHEAEVRRLDAIQKNAARAAKSETESPEPVEDPFAPVVVSGGKQTIDPADDDGDLITETDDPDADLETQILDYHRQGLRPGEISAALDGAVKWQSVASIIRKAEAEGATT